MADPRFPQIASVGVYYARHGRLILVPVEEIAPPEALDRAEKKIFARADQLQAERSAADEVL